MTIHKTYELIEWSGFYQSESQAWAIVKRETTMGAARIVCDPYVIESDDRELLLDCGSVDYGGDWDQAFDRRLVMVDDQLWLARVVRAWVPKPR